MLACSIVHMHNMPRPRKNRLCRAHNGDPVFKPRSIPLRELEITPIGWSELDTLRLCDLEELGQQEAGARMGVSRGTVFRLLKSGRAKLVRALVETKALVITKGVNDEDLHSD